MKYMSKLLVGILMTLISWNAFAWDHSIQLAYGNYHDPNNIAYNNSGYFLSGDLIPLRRTPWTFWSIEGALGQWHNTNDEHRNLTTAALSLGLRLYPFCILHQYPTYLILSEGPAYISERKFGTNEQGLNLTFQSLAGLGIEFNQVDVGLRFVHYSNANLAKPNNGYNFFYMLSVGYLF